MIKTTNGTNQYCETTQETAERRTSGLENVYTSSCEPYVQRTRQSSL